MTKATKKKASTSVSRNAKPAASTTFVQAPAPGTNTTSVQAIKSAIKIKKKKLFHSYYRALPEEFNFKAGHGSHEWKTLGKENTVNDTESESVAASNHDNVELEAEPEPEVLSSLFLIHNMTVIN
jgi:hypothetical protein